MLKPGETLLFDLLQVPYHEAPAPWKSNEKENPREYVRQLIPNSTLKRPKYIYLRHIYDFTQVL